MSFFDTLFGCPHPRMSRVFTPRVPSVKRLSYVVCLECGAEFEYDLVRMRQGKKIFRGAERPDMVTLERALADERELLFAAGRETEAAQPAATAKRAAERT